LQKYMKIFRNILTKQGGREYNLTIDSKGAVGNKPMASFLLEKYL